MTKKNKILVTSLGACIALTAAWMLWAKDNSSIKTREEKAKQVSENYSLDKGKDQVVQNQEKPPQISKYEERLTDIEVDLTYLEDFIGRGKQFILKRQIQSLIDGATSVICLEYQRSVPDDMRMEFFFLCDTGEILKGYYNYHTRETSVECTDLSEGDVWAMQEKEKTALEKEENKAVEGNEVEELPPQESESDT